MSKKERAGREFEELIAKIEQNLSPKGAVVKSPDYIRDKVTNRLREVDASIRLPNGDANYLITVECRDHKKGRQDDRWIEQLITKREKIGASRTIAVSSTGFSDSAIATARHFGIELRRLDQITDAEIAQEWAAGFRITLLVLDYSVVDIVIIDSNRGTISKENLLLDLISAWKKDPLNTEFLRNIDDGTSVSARDLINLGGSPPNLEENGEPIGYTWTVNCENNAWCIDTLNGEKVVSQVIIKCVYRLRGVPAPIQRVKQYNSNDEPLVELVGSSVDVDDQTFDIEATVHLNKPVPIHTASKKKSKVKL